MKRTIRIGTRKSSLAMVQTNLIIDKLKQLDVELQFEIFPISTVGDEILNKPLIEFGGKGVFVDAFEEALLKGSIDLAVHSAKDMTLQLPEGLGILGILQREDPRDVLITIKGWKPANRKILIGTSSLRRQFQVEQFYEAEFKSLRGNVPTRLDKLKSGEFDAIILAAAGLKRLKLIDCEEYDYRFFTTEEFIPAAGQGIIAVEGRQDSDLAELVRKINDTNTTICLETERKVLGLMDAGCHEAIGVFSNIQDNTLSIDAVYYNQGKFHRVKEFGASKDYLLIAEAAAKKLI